MTSGPVTKAVTGCTKPGVCGSGEVEINKVETQKKKQLSLKSMILLSR